MEKKNKLVNKMIVIATLAWFVFIFTPIGIMLYNKNVASLFKIWGVILTILITILIMLYCLYKRK